MDGFIEVSRGERGDGGGKGMWSGVEVFGKGREEGGTDSRSTTFNTIIMASTFRINMLYYTE